MTRREFGRLLVVVFYEYGIEDPRTAVETFMGRLAEEPSDPTPILTLLDEVLRHSGRRYHSWSVKEHHTIEHKKEGVIYALEVKDG